MKNQYIEIGKVTAVHGIMGEVRVQPWADSPDFLCQFDTLYIDDAHCPVKVERARVHKNMCIVKFEGPTDVPSALSFRNAVLYFNRDDVKLPEGRFFITDIIGLPVVDAETGEELGKLAEVMNMPAHDLYLVKGGSRELMIPAVPTFIKETNLDEGFIRVQMMEGL